MKAKKFESALHAELGMTDAEIRAELRAEGLDPEAEAQGLRSMVRRLAAKHTAQDPEQQRLGELVARKFAVFHESVAAGPPAPVAGVEPERADLLDLMKSGDPSTLMWARVSGWSMRDKGIHDGDLVLVDTNREARDGDIVLAHLAGRGQVVKSLRLPGSGIAVLESANPDFEPITIKDPADLAIHGVVVARAGKL